MFISVYVQMMISERQNREKSLHRRRKKEQIIEIANNQDDDDDADGDDDEVDEDETDMEKSTMNEAMVETNEAVTVNMEMCILAHFRPLLKSPKFMYGFDFLLVFFGV